MDEKENFYRFCALLLDVGVIVLREVLTFHHLGSNTLAAYLSSNKSHLTKLPLSVIRQEQRDTLFPPSGQNALIEDFDITLLCVLFRNLDSSKPSNNPVWSSPSVTDHSFQADVGRIRVIRNCLFGHVSSARLDNSTFNTEASNLKTIYHRLISALPASRISGSDLQQMIEKELKGPLQPELENEIKRMREKLDEWQRYDEDIKLTLREMKADMQEISKIQRDDVVNVRQELGVVREDVKSLHDKTDAEIAESRKAEGDLCMDLDSLRNRVDVMKKDDVVNIRQELGVVREDVKSLHDKTDAEIAESRKAEGDLCMDLDSLRNRVDFMEKESIDVKKQWDTLSKEGKTFIDKREQQRIIYLSQMILEQHRCHAEKNFVETEGYRAANEMVTRHRRLILAGKSGQGKSYLARHLLNKIIAGDSNIKPLIISDVEQWKCLVDSSITLGIIVDDMCGKFSLNEGELMKWRQESTYMQGLIENGKHVVIFTMKSFLYEKILKAMQFCPLFSTRIILNLDNIQLNLEEKTELADTYLKEFGLNNVEVSDLCKVREASVGFPQLCRLAEMIKEKSKLFDLFSRPRECIQEQINHISQNDSMTYACLALVMLSSGKLNMQSIKEFGDDGEKKDNRVISVFGSCGIRDVIPIKVLDMVRSLQGIYLSLDATEDSCSFDHDSIEEAVFISYGENFPEQTLRYCHLELICKHCKYDPKALKTTPQDNTLILQPCYQNILINRFITALREGNPTDFTIISEANIWACKEFGKAFFPKCKDIHFLADKDQNSLLVHAASTNNRDLVDELLHELDYIPEDKKKKVAQFLTKSAKASCAHKDTFLLEKICNMYRIDINDILPDTIQDGSVEAVEFLLQSGADVNYRSKKGENLLHIACLHGRLDIVKLLHSKNANLMNQCDDHNRSVSHCVAAGGSIDILHFLSALGLNTSYTDSTGWNMLHYACWKGKKNMAQHLIDKYPQLLLGKTEEGMVVLLCAAFGGNVSIFNKIYELMEDLLKVHQSTYENLMPRTSNKQTLLHMSCLGGHLEMTKHLVESCPTMIHQVDNSKRTPAHYAAHSGNVDVLRYLIVRGTDPWCRTSEEETLLHRACIAGQLEMTKYLVETYPNMLHQLDNEKRTPAHKAAQSGNVTVLSYLIDRGTDPWCRTSEDETLLHRACIAGQLEMTKYLVETYPNMLHQFDNSKRTPAHYAAHSGNVTVLSYLIDRGTDPWCRTSKDKTLLHRACIAGQLEMTKYLVETYPNMLQQVDNEKRTPAHNAAVSGNVTVLSYLIDRGTDPWCRTSEDETLLHRACIAGQLEMTKYLVETYPNMLHQVDNSKSTPAHNAAVSGNVTVLSYLIDRGTDPWCRTSEDETLLHRACIAGQLEMTKYLVETYPNMLHQVDNKKRTPAHNAAVSGNVTVLSYLIDRGTDPWCRTSEDETLLHRACIACQLEMTKYLVETYPNMLHQVDNKKRTPAHNAAVSGNVTVLSYLIDRGTDPWCRTSEDETLLHRACIACQLEMTKYLVETYPNMLHQVDNKKRTPALYSAQRGNVALLSYLIDRGTDPWCRTSEDETLLHRACIAGQLEMTKYLVETYPNMLHQVDNKKRTPAHNAAVSGNVTVLSYLIDRGTDPWCRTSEDETLLHRACIACQLEMTKYLVETYPNMLHQFDNSKRTPAHKAAQSGNVTVLSYLIDRGTDPWCRTSEEETLLHRACIAGQLEMTKYLVETYPNMLHQVDNSKSTPAHNAADSGNVTVLSYLIDRGTDPWCRTSEDETLLHRACIAGQLEMTKYLVETYPNMLHQLDNEKRTPAHNAAVSGNVTVLSYLIDRGTDPWCRTSEDETLLHRACIAGQLEMTKYLVETYPNMLHQFDNSKRTPAHYAAHSGNVTVLSYLIDRGTDPWCRTSEDETLLHRACIAGQLEMTKYLVETYPNMLHQVDNKKRTPAHNAAVSGNVTVLSYLIDRGTDPWCRTSEDESLLHRACIAGQLEMTKYLVETYPNMLHQVDNKKRTPAHNAAVSGNVTVLSYLIDRGTDPWCRTSEDETLLHRACIAGQLEMTKYLVETYPNMLHQLDNEKRTPAHKAAQSGNVTVLSYLIDRGTDPWCRTSEDETLLHRACIAGQLEMTKYLVETYPNMLHQVDNKKRTPAHNAAVSGNVTVLSYLIDRGTDPWCRTSEDETLLHRACIAGQLEMTKYLVETYPNMLHQVDNKKRTPAHNAAVSGNVTVLSYLIDRGTDPWCRTSEDETLLHRACIAGQLEMTKYLVETYPNMLHQVDNKKRTPAHNAAVSGNVTVLSYLIDRGTDPWCRTSEDETLLHRACIAGQLEMTKYLVETYPNMLHQVDNKKRTPAHNAAVSGNVTVLSYLIDRGTDPWCRTSEDETLLHRACIAGQLEMTKYLVETYPNMLHQVDNKKRTPALYSAQRGNVALLSYLIDRGTDPWCRTSEDETLLHRACIACQLEMTKYLVETYPNMLHQFDNKKRTPAHKAAQSGNVTVLSYLIDRGTDPWCRTSEEETLLHRACIAGQLEMTKYLVETYPNMLHQVDNSKSTPAHNAADSGNVTVLSYLIDRGTDPWCRTSEDETLLHRACIAGQLEMTKYLVETYPNMLHQVDNKKRTPAHNAAVSGNVTVLSYLIDRGTDPWCRTSEDETLLHRACIAGQLEMTKYLVETYPNMLHQVDNKKRTPAHNAAVSGNVTVLSYLIDRGTDPWCRTSEDETLLHRACIACQLEMTKYLVETYPNILHQVDNKKRTPAHNAEVSGNVTVLSSLIDRGTDPWCRTSEDETLLHRACIAGQLEMTKYLVETYPYMLHQVDNSKSTPAHNAADSGNVTVLSYLIDRGTDPWCRTSEDETLLHRACIACQLEMTKYLVETYPNMLHQFDNSKRTPAHKAAVSGNVTVLSYLIDRGTDPWCRTSEDETLLHRACIAGQLEMTKYLVETYPNMLHQVDNKKRTPALYSAQRGNVALLSYLIDRGTDPWCRTSEDETLLHRACIAGQLEMTKYLVETYPNMLHQVDNKKRTPALYSAQRGNVALLSYLIDRGTDPWCRTSEDETLLHRACIAGQLEMTKYLVETYPNMLHQVDNKKRTPALYSAQRGNVTLLSYLIDRGTDPWCRTSEDETLLHRACIACQLEMTKYLVETYPNMLHQFDNSKRTPAHYAAHSGNVTVLSYLIDCGTDPWCRTSKDETLLHRACIAGQLEMTKYLVETYPNMLHQVDNKKRTPAHNAAVSGNVTVLSYLIDRGTDPWCRTSEDETLLHRACIAGQLEMTKYLVETYPNMLHQVDNKKRTPAHNAAVSGNVTVLSYLIDRGTDPWCRTSEDETLLHRACIAGQLEMTKYLVETYPNMLHQVDNSKSTPAHNAADSGNVTVLSYLIDRGTDPWCRTSKDETLLHSACIAGQLEMTKYLVETDPNMLHQVDNKKRTPAHNAAVSGNVTVLSYLIDRGTDPWCRTSEDETLLHRACIAGQLEMTKYLVETYPNMLHQVDNKKRTPAHNAAVSGNVTVLSYLIDRGTDPWCRTSEDETLLHRACIAGQLEMTKYLVETYPNMLHQVDNKKRTPALYAAHRGNVALLSYLIDRGTGPCVEPLKTKRRCTEHALQIS